MFDEDRSDIPPQAVRDRQTDAAYPRITEPGMHDAADAASRPEDDWTFGIVSSGAQRRGNTPETRLLAIFDVFDEWFRRDDHEARTFISVLLDMEPEHPSGHTSVVHLDRIRLFAENLARQAGLVDVEEFTLSWHILMTGAVLNAADGDAEAARRAREMASDLIARFSPDSLRARRASAAPDNDIEWEYEDTLSGRQPRVDSSLSFDDYH